VSEVPPDLQYTTDHEWIRRTGADTVRVGITDYAQSALGDVVFVQLPEAGAAVTAGDPFGEVESTKSVSDLFAPISANVLAVNGDLDANPDLVNSDPYGAGWMVDLQIGPEMGEAGLDSALAGLLDADGYRATLTE
jgi:glycine cleavage system H protein